MLAHKNDVIKPSDLLCRIINKPRIKLISDKGGGKQVFKCESLEKSNLNDCIDNLMVCQKT